MVQVSQACYNIQSFYLFVVGPIASYSLNWQFLHRRHFDSRHSTGRPGNFHSRNQYLSGTVSVSRMAASRPPCHAMVRAGTSALAILGLRLPVTPSRSCCCAGGGLGAGATWQACALGLTQTLEIADVATNLLMVAKARFAGPDRCPTRLSHLPWRWRPGHPDSPLAACRSAARSPGPYGPITFTEQARQPDSEHSLAGSACGPAAGPYRARSALSGTPSRAAAWPRAGPTSSNVGHHDPSGLLRPPPCAKRHSGSPAAWGLGCQSESSGMLTPLMSFCVLEIYQGYLWLSQVTPWIYQIHVRAPYLNLSCFFDHIPYLVWLWILLG